MKFKKVYIGIIFALTIAVVGIISERAKFNQFFSPVKLRYINSYLQNNYLYEVDEEEGLRSVYSGYVSGTENAVTYYLDEADFKAAKITEAGSYFGTGMVVMWSMDGQSFIVTEVVTDSPAEKAGIKVGDKITKINETPVLLSNSNKLIEEAFSNQEKEVNYSIVSGNSQMEVSLMPEEAALSDMEYETMEEVLYIKLNTIQQGTSERMAKLIGKQDQGCKGVILDIRDLYSNNLEEISKICDLFLEKGTAFKVKAKNDKMAVYTMTPGVINHQLCLIVNNSTKAGAEALVLGLKDRSYIVGSDTKGLQYIRTLVALDDGSGVSVASGIVCDQYGEILPEAGIKPNERVYISEEEKAELLETGTIARSHDSFIKAALTHFRG